jgi:transcriptional regulator GlxA family with amidase domain
MEIVMSTAIEKLFKGYSVKEIEEIVIKAGFAANKTTKKHYPKLISPLPRNEKRKWFM